MATVFAAVDTIVPLSANVNHIYIYIGSNADEYNFLYNIYNVSGKMDRKKRT